MAEPDRNPGRISAMCWDDRHARCTGWMILPGSALQGVSVRCACTTCNHPKVAPDRHLHESARGATWNSSTKSR